MTPPARGTADVLLTDGTVAVIRAIAPEDRDAVALLHEGVSDTSFRRRFFSSGRAAGRHYVTHLFSPTPPETALVAEAAGRVVAVGTAERVDPTTSEIAFLVADDLHGRGVGSLLLEHLAAASRDRGVLRFVAEVLPENSPMTRVFAAAGFATTRSTSRGIVDVEMSTAASALAVAAADRRESLSEARSLRGLLRPRRVAVVSSGPGCGAVPTAIRAGGFTGELVTLEPGGHADHGATPDRPVDVPGDVDLVVVAVLPCDLHGVMCDVVRRGPTVVVVLSAVDGATASESAESRRDLVRLCRSHSVRLVGPGSLGVQVLAPDVALDTIGVVPRAASGGLAIAVQSAVAGHAVMAAAVRSGVGVHSVVSLGDKADVSGNDLVAAWAGATGVTAAALVLTSMGNAPKFARLARAFSERRPLLVLPAHRSLGAEPTTGPTGGDRSAARPLSSLAWDALGGHSGIIRCRTADELAWTARVLAEQPLPRGVRTALLTGPDTGGADPGGADPGGAGASAVTAAGLVVATVPADLRAGSAAEAVPRLLGTGGVDAVILLVGGTARLWTTAGDGSSPAPAPTPLPTLEAALGALAHASRYARWRSSARSEPSPEEDPGRRTAARAVARELSATTPPGSRLDVGQVRRLLMPYGLSPGDDADPSSVLDDGTRAADAAVRVVIRIVRDDQLGPLITLEVRDGGRTAHDTGRTGLLPPLDAGSVARAVASLPWPQEVRHGPPPDSARAVTTMVMALGHVVAEVPEVVGLDLTVVAGSTTTRVQEARVRLGRPDRHDAGVPRRLGRPD